MSRLDGSTVVVTGGAVGIGRAISERLARDGAHVVVVDIQDGTGTVEAVEGAGGSAEYREGDVTDAERMREICRAFDLDGLVNNAAYFAPLLQDKKPFEEIPEDEWDTVMDVNVKGVFLASRAALPRLGEGSAIVNISSGTVLRGGAGYLHYVASKAAVLGMTRAMATELGDRGVRVNAVMPGLTASDAILRTGEDTVDSTVETQLIDSRIEPADIADAVAFLLGPDSDKMTGQVLNVDGGRSFY